MFPLETLMKSFVKVGTLTILDVEGTTHVFKGAPGPEVTIRLRDPKLYRSLFFHPELHAGEAYMDGTLTIEKGTIRDFLTLSVMNARNLRKHPLQKLLNSSLKRMRKLHQRNKPKVAKARYTAIGNGDTRTNVAIAGDADIIFTTVPSATPRIDAAGQMKLQSLTIPRIRVAAFNSGLHNH